MFLLSTTWSTSKLLGSVRDRNKEVVSIIYYKNNMVYSFLLADLIWNVPGKCIFAGECPLAIFAPKYFIRMYSTWYKI